MGDSNSKGKEVSQCGSNPDVEPSVINSSETKLDPSQDDEGELEVVSKRNKNKPGNTLDDSDDDLASDNYQEYDVSRISEDNQQLNNELSKQSKHAKVLEEYLKILSQKIKEGGVIETNRAIPNDLTSQIIMKLPLKSAARFCAVSPNWERLISANWRALIAADIACSWSKSFENPRLLLSSYTGFDYSRSGSRWFHSVRQSMPPQLWNKNHVVLQNFRTFRYISPPVRGSIICYQTNGESAICNPAWGVHRLLPMLPPDLKMRYTSIFHLGFDQDIGIFKVLSVIHLGGKPIEFRVLSLVDENSSWRRLRSNKEWKSVDYKEHCKAGNSSVFLEGKIYFEAGVSVIMCFDVKKEDFRVIPLPMGVEVRRDSLMKVNQKLGFISDSRIWILEEEWRRLDYSIPTELGKPYQCLGTIGKDIFVFTSTCVPLTIFEYDASKQLVENIPIDYNEYTDHSNPQFFECFIDYIESPYPDVYSTTQEALEERRLEEISKLQMATYSTGTVDCPGSPKSVRIVVVGDERTGKSSLIVAAASDDFPPYVCPVLPDTKLPLELSPDGVSVTIVDTSSRPEDRDMVAKELRNADAVVLTYDCARPETLEGLSKYWLPELRRLEVKVPIIVAGCKLDLRDDNNPVSVEQVMSRIMHQFREIETCIECSARKKLQTKEVFCSAQKRVLHPTGHLFDQESQSLKPRCVRALKRIFVLCDHDRDGALSEAEFNDFQVKCSHAPLQPSEFEGFKRAVQEKLPVGVNERGLTETGFLFLHAFFIEKGRLETTRTVLRKFGYNNDIRLADELLPPSLFKRAPDQSFELTDVAIDFLKGMYALFDDDGDNNLRPQEIENLFSTAPESPWTEAPYVDAAEKTALGGLSLDAFLALWSLMTTLEPARSVEHLICVGFQGDPSSAIRLTRGRRLDRKKHQSERRVFQCFVFGPNNAGKSALLNCFLGRSYADNPGSTADERYAVNMVDESGSAKKTLVMREIPEDGAKGLFSSKESLAACDIALFVYDSSDESSWKRGSELLVEVATHGEATGYEVPCFMVSAKDDLDSFPISIQESTRVTQDMGIEPPVSISFKLGDFNDLFRKILTAAQHLHLSIPETEAGKSRKRFNRLINRSLMAVAIGAASVVVGLVAAARKNASA